MALAALLAAGTPALASEAEQSDSLMDESLESLLSMNITSVSKRPQQVVETPAAIFVLTQDDIRRSGHTSVPELLRMVPGVNMGRATARGWNIGVRGDQSQLSRMLLVLVDGRAAYTTLFNGTWWDEVDVPLEDIERIEVIRGPGASVWGANAVDGVINILRKAPASSESYAKTVVGSEDRLIQSLGYTGSTGDLSYRASGQWVSRDGFRARDGSAEQHDDCTSSVASMRMDLALSDRDRLKLQADSYQADQGTSSRRDLDTSGTSVLISFDTRSVRTWNAMLTLERDHSDTAGSELQLYIDHRYRDLLVAEDRRTYYDLELRNRFQLSPHQLVSWGFGARHVQERIGPTFNALANPEHQDEAIHNVFAQDEIALAEGALRLTFGSKFEWNTYTGWEVQPTARFLWHAAEQQQIWGAVSRAVRVPSRVDRGEFQPVPAYLFGMPLGIRGDRDADAEIIVAYDLGYRWQATPRLHLDLAAFAQRAQNYQVVVPGPPFGLGLTFSGSSERSAVGAEAAIRWQPRDDTRFFVSWSHAQIQHSGNAFTPSGTKSAPPHQLGVRASFDLPSDVSLDLSAHYHGRVGTRFSTVIGDSLNSYVRGDVRIAWQPTESLQLSLVGQNLFDRRHLEAVDFIEANPLTTGQQPSSVERGVYASVRWSF